MSKDPAFLFYSSDFLSGTMLMSNEQIGKYTRLMCLQHQKGHLKEKDMLSICETYDEDIFSKFKKDEDGNYFNERLEKEINKRKAYSESRRRNRQKKDEDMNNICNTHDEDMNNISDTYVEHMENENEDVNINININKNINNIFNFIEQEFGRTLSPTEYEVIESWEDTELTRYAIKQAILNGAPRIKYIQTILDSYKTKNIKSVQEAQIDEENFKKGKQPKETPVPDWVDKEIKKKSLSKENKEKMEELLKEFK